MPGFWTRILTLVAGRHAADPLLDVAVERAVDRVQPHLKTLRAYPRRYRDTVLGILTRVGKLSAEVPGPVTLDAGHYIRDPFVHALFGSPEDIARLYATPAIFAYMTQHDGGDLYALLSMRREEKPVFGLELDGAVLRRDVAQRVIHFTDLQLIGPAPTEQEARDNLRWYLFDRYMDHVAEGLERLRSERQRLDVEKDLALARLRAVSTYRRPVRQRELDTVLACLGEVTATLDLEHLDEVFDVVLSHPEDCLSLAVRHLNLDAMGIVHADDGSVEAVDLEFVDLIERDRETRTVVLVHCPAVTPVSPGKMIEDAMQRLG